MEEYEEDDDDEEEDDGGHNNLAADGARFAWVAPDSVLLARVDRRHGDDER